MKKKYLTLVYLLLNIAIIAAIGILDPNLKDPRQILHGIQFRWIMGAAFCMVMFFALDGIIIHYSIVSIMGKGSIAKSIKVALLGKYYNAVTPFAGGGQPYQIYYMLRSGIPAGYASSSMIIKFLIYQAALSIISIAAFIYKGEFIQTYSGIIFIAAFIGFLVSFVGPVLLYILALNKGAIRFIMLKFLRFLYKVRLVKNIDRTRERLLSHAKDFHNSIKLFDRNPRGLIFMTILMIMEQVFLFTIPYFIYRAYGLHGAGLLDMIFVHVFLYLATSFFPTPGASGASEGGFYVLFKLFFPKNIIFSAMLIWRIISYYITVLAGGLVISIESLRKILKSRP